MASNVTVRDLGWKNAKAAVKALDGRGVKVGFPAGKAPGDVIDYAAYNEFGTEHIPSRPFMRRSVDTAEREIASFGKAQAMAVASGAITAEQALDRLGLWFQSRIQNTITTARGWAVPNAPATVRQKGSSSPLIDTGRMRAAVTYEKDRG